MDPTSGGPDHPEPVEEQVALVDAEGREVDTAPRSQVRRENLRHAGTGVLLRHPDGRIYVHRRSESKDWCPGHHDAAAGGVMRSGEVPAASAARELAEELGIRSVRLRPVLSALFEDRTVRVFVHVFEARSPGPVVHEDGEVVWGRWMELQELGRLMDDRSWPMVPDTRFLLRELARRRVGDYARLLGG